MIGWSEIKIENLEKWVQCGPRWNKTSDRYIKPKGWFQNNFKIKSIKNRIRDFGYFLKLSKQKEPEAQIQIEKENLEILEPNAENHSHVSATNDNEELSLEDEIQSINRCSSRSF